VILTLDPVDLEHLYYIKCHVAKVCKKFERNRTTPAELLIIQQRFVPVTSRCDLDL